MLDEQARSWVAAHLGSEVVSSSVLTGGISSQMLAIRTLAGDDAVLRRMTVDPWRRFAGELLQREYDVQAMLHDVPVHAPDPIAWTWTGLRPASPRC